ncbi:hypothetical protein FQN52_004115 [Onygenales sp. PD_12]|nr:hypothetical protein FQN52_004115 [Onygenales sp. PD_12]
MGLSNCRRNTNTGLLTPLLALTALLSGVASASPHQGNEARAQAILKSSPLIDGHNDFPYFIRETTHDQIYDGKLDFEGHLSGSTDLKRLREGKLGGQFWSVFVDCLPDPNATPDSPSWVVRNTLEQIDVTKRWAELYSDDLQFCETPACAHDAFKKGKIGSFIGVEGGHQVGNSLGALRTLYDLGARYMTITHDCDNAWATAAATVKNGGEDKGLTDFGPELIKEMNRLGMVVDLSHVSPNTMRDVLKVTDVPVMFSHSSAYAVSNHIRNVPDDVLLMVKENNGVVMVTFVNNFVNVTNPESADIEAVVDHIYHIADIAGWDHVGLGGDFDGTDDLPIGLEDVSKYPDLIKHVLDRGATDKQVRKLTGQNILRVWTEVEKRGKEIRKAGAFPNEAMWSGRNWTEY